MSFDLLLYWMTHTGEGSWAGFKKALSVIMPDAPDQASLTRRVRVTLSDLGHIDFFIDGTQRWRARPAILAGIGSDGSTAALCGSRTPAMLLSLQAAVHECDCVLSVTRVVDGPSRVAVSGNAIDIQQVADRAEIVFVPRAPIQLLTSVGSIVSLMKDAPHEPLPSNWKAESFDLNTLMWKEGISVQSACRFTPRFGAAKFLLHRRRHRFLRMRKREAVYASAMIQGVRLLSYDPFTQTLTAPLAAPMPEELARAVALCSASPPRVDQGTLVYANVPFAVASAVFTTAGQQHPAADQIADGRRFTFG